MNRSEAIPVARIISADPTTGPRQAPPRRGTGVELSTRLATPADVPWLQSLGSHYDLPVPRSGRTSSFVLLRGGQRVGFMAVRRSELDQGRGPEPTLWIVSAFLVPAMRAQGLILKFGEILSRDIYREGAVACRVATDNTRMLRLMARGNWKKIHETRQYIDFMIELDGPFRASRRM